MALQNVKAPSKVTKVCPHCGVTKQLTDFYTNKDWDEQLGRDSWCKLCVGKCDTKDDMRRYFWENNRAWNERLWDAARSKAEKIAATSEVYQKSHEERRKRLLEKLTCQTVPKIMHTFYQYVENSRVDGALTYDEAKERGEIIEEEDEDVKVYSNEFNGYFKKKELDYLHDYYRGLSEDFDLNDTNLRDIAKKLAKASLVADKAQDDYMAGRCDFSVVKDSLAQFDLLSKSGNFAACKRKPGDTAGMGSFAEISQKLETSGYPCTRKIVWDQDDVDRTIAEYEHILEALDLTGAG